MRNNEDLRIFSVGVFIEDNINTTSLGLTNDTVNVTEIDTNDRHFFTLFELLLSRSLCTLVKEKKDHFLFGAQFSRILPTTYYKSIHYARAFKLNLL
jgi:hypothetical protein